MLRKLLIVLALALSFCYIFGLTAGDIAILGVNADATKSIVFVALEDIPAATDITFTDNAWDATNQVWRTGEGSIVWSTASQVAKGSVVTITLGTTYTTDVGTVTTSSNFNLSTSGDQVLAYVGTTAPTTNNDNTWLYGFSIENWVWANNTNTSDIPTALIGANVGLTDSTTEFDNGHFANGNTAQTSVSVSGTKAALLAMFGNNTLYYTNNTGPLTFPTYTVTVSGAPVPMITASGTLNPFSATTGTPSAAQSYTLSGIDLTANIAVTAPAGYQISSNGTDYSNTLSLAPDYNAPVYVRLTGTTAGTFEGNITHTSGEATQVDKAVTGTVTDPVPMINVTGTLNAFSTEVGTPSDSQNYTLSGDLLTADIIVTAPAGFEISTDNSSFQSSLTLASTFDGLLYVRLTGTTVGAYSGDITHASTGAAQVDLAASGNVTEVIPPLAFMEENFAYTAGTTVVSNGWSAHNGAGTASPLVDATNLTYTGYLPNLGGSARTTGVTGEDISRGFLQQTSGEVYVAWLMNITGLPNTTQDYCFHLGDAAVPNGGTTFRGRLYVQRNADNQIRFGISKSSGNTGIVQWTGGLFSGGTYDYALNTTYLMVMKYKMIEGTTPNDEVYLWINPAISATEPAHTLFVGSADTTSDPSNIGSVAIRQSANTPAAYYDGIRITNDWATLWNDQAPLIPVITATGDPAPMVSIPGSPSEEYAEYQLSGEYLNGPITVNAPAHFEVSSTGTDGWAASIQVPADFNGTIFVRLNSSEVGEHSGFITHTSPGAQEVTMRVEGEVIAPEVVWNITANLVPFAAEFEQPSDIQSYTLSATNATTDLLLSVSGGPFEFAITETGPWSTSGSLPPTFNGLVYVRMLSTEAGTFNGIITHANTNASPYELPVTGTVAAEPGIYATDLFFSEYLEGDSNNKALEIFNGTGAAVDLGAYKVVLYSNGSSTPGNTLTFTPGTMLAHNDVYVIANSSSIPEILALADVTSTVTYFNGDDAVALIKTVETVDQYVDIIGMIGQDPGTQWTADGGYSTLDKTLVRKPTITQGVSVNPSGHGGGDVTAFETLGTEWDVYPINTISYLGAHTFTPGMEIAAAPVILPAGGIKTSPVNVTMSTTTPGATIYYTIDGSVPSDASLNYSTTGSFVVSTSTVVKAITYAPGFAPSAVTEVEYIYPTPVITIAALRAMPTGGTFYLLTTEAVLTFQQSTRHQKYIQDATAAIVIDDAAGVITTTYNLYDGITGIAGTLGVYSGLLQFTPVVNTEPATSTGNVIVPEVRTLASLTTDDQAKLIKVMNATLDATLVNFPATASNVTISDASGAAVLRTFPGTDYSGTPIPVDPVNVIGLVGQYNATMQISPRFLADFEAAGGTLMPPDPVISQAAGMITVSWAAVDGATNYEVYGSDNPYSGFTLLDTVGVTSYSTAALNMKFFYVRAIN